MIGYWGNNRMSIKGKMLEAWDKFISLDSFKQRVMVPAEIKDDVLNKVLETDLPIEFMDEQRDEVMKAFDTKAHIIALQNEVKRQQDNIAEYKNIVDMMKSVIEDKDAEIADLKKLNSVADGKGYDASMKGFKL